MNIWIKETWLNTWTDYIITVVPHLYIFLKPFWLLMNFIIDMISNHIPAYCAINIAFVDFCFLFIFAFYSFHILFIIAIASEWNEIVKNRRALMKLQKQHALKGGNYIILTYRAHVSQLSFLCIHSFFHRHLLLLVEG